MIKVLGLDANADLSASPANTVFVQEVCPVEAEQVTPGCSADTIPRRGEVLRWNSLGRPGRPWPELTSASAIAAITGNLSAVRFDPSNLGVTKSSKSNWIVVDCRYSVDCFRDPESQVGDLTRELMGILCCEAVKLIRDYGSSFDRI